MAEEIAIPAEARHCDACGSLIPAGAPGGQCPRCLLSLASAASLLGVADDALLDPVQVREFGDYELLEEIARGGMGVVYRAWQRSAEREVAVKMILAGQLATPAAVARFRNEAAAAAKLDHPNIVPVYEVGEFETQHFFSMRYIPGGRNIAQWARALPAATRFQAIALAMAEVARAVAFAHGHGVLHRDLKPSNILIDENDEPQVTDFGLAKLLDDPAAPALTGTSMILGSPSYMAPEQAAARGDEVTTATDVYGLGAILYELLAGRPPFTGASPHLVARKVIEDPPRRLLDVPDDLETLCRQCLAKNPRDRYASAAALAADLDRFARGEPVEAVRESALSLAVLWARHKPIAAGLAVALAFTVLAGFIAVFWQWRHAEAARRETVAASAEVSAVNARLRDSLSRLEWRQLEVLLERDLAPRALAELAARLRADPWSWPAATYALSILEQRPFAFPAAAPVPIEEEWLAVPPALSAAGSRAAVAARDGRVRLIDAARGTDAAPPWPGGPVGALAFSPDGTRLAVGEKSGAIVLRDAASGRLLSRTTTLAIPLRALAFSADGGTLAFAGGELIGAGPVAEFAAGLTPLRLFAAGFPAGEIRCSADGRTLLAWSGGKGSRLVVHGPPGGGEALAPALPAAVRGASLDAAGARVAIGVGAYEVQVWDVARRTRLSTLEHPGSPVDRLALTPDGRFVIVSTRDGHSRTYSAETGLPTSALVTQRYSITGLTLDAAGERALTTSQDFTARLWNVRTGHALGQALAHPGPLEAGALAADATRGVTLARLPGRQTRLLHAWRLRPPAGPRTFRPTGGRDHEAARLSPDERLFAIGTSVPQTSLTVFDVASGHPLLDRAPTTGSVYACEFTPDGRRLLVATNAGWLHGWAVPAPGQTAWTPLWPPVDTGHKLQPATLAPDGASIALGGTDGTLRLYATADATLQREMKHGALIKGVRFSPDGTHLATAGADGLAHVWQVSSGKKVATLRGHTAEILSARFSPDGTRLVTASYDSTARLWDAATGQPLTPPLHHRGELSTASFSPDGRLLGTASRDATACIWDAATGRLVFEPLAHPSTVQTVAFHPDGRRFLTLDLTGFRLWDVTTGEPVTPPYPLAFHAGLGLDSPSFQDIFSPRGGHLAVGNALDDAVYWPLPDPPAPVPAWFPDFLDALATGGLPPPGSSDAPTANRLLPWLDRARAFHDTDFYERWVRQYLGLAGGVPRPP